MHAKTQIANKCKTFYIKEKNFKQKNYKKLK